jgi:hypothetical protein
MAHLSILHQDGIMVTCANPVHLTEPADFRDGGRIAFEVLEADASYLKRLIGKTETFGLDPQQLPLSARLIALEPCKSTVDALSLLRHKPAMRGVLSIHRVIDFTAEQENAN